MYSLSVPRVVFPRSSKGDWRSVVISPACPGGVRPTNSFLMHSELKFAFPVIALLQFSNNQITKFCRTRDVVLGLGACLSSRNAAVVFLKKKWRFGFKPTACVSVVLS